MKEKSTRIGTFTTCLSLACLLLTGSALAGDLTEDTTEFDIATDCFTTPLTNADQVYTMGIPRTVDFVARWNLNIGQFDGTPTLTQGGAGAADIGLRSGGDGSSQVAFNVVINTDLDTTTTLTLDTPVVLFPEGSPAVATMTITIDLLDLVGPIDTAGVHTVDLAVLTNRCVQCPDIAEFTEMSLAAALSSEESVVARLERVSSRAETIAEVRTRDIDSMVDDLADASLAISDVSDALDLAEANQCLFTGELVLVRPDISAASTLDDYVSSRLGDPFAEVTVQTLLNLYGPSR